MQIMVNRLPNDYYPIPSIASYYLTGIPSLIRIYDLEQKKNLKNSVLSG
jgi:hypothetical protein